MALTDAGLRLKSIKEKGGELEDYFVTSSMEDKAMGKLLKLVFFRLAKKRLR
jgi:hypothetical protein